MCWGLLSDSLALHSPALGACQRLTASPLKLTTAQSGEEGTGLFKENFTKKKKKEGTEAEEGDCMYGTGAPYPAHFPEPVMSGQVSLFPAL